jgi:hypothetical protein
MLSDREAQINRLVSMAANFKIAATSQPVYILVSIHFTAVGLQTTSTDVMTSR